MESSRETGLTGDRRSGGAASEERGEKKHVVREHGLSTVPCFRNLKKKTTGQKGFRGGAIRKQQGTRNYRVQQECGRTAKEETGSHNPRIRGIGSTLADGPVTRGDREKETRVPGAWDTEETGAAPSCTGGSVCSVAEADVAA